MTRASKPQLRFVWNFLSLSGGEVLSKFLTLTAIAWTARVVGPAGFGRLELAGSLVLCAALLVEEGFGAYGAREIARDPQATRRLLAEITTLRSILAGGVYGVLLLLVVLLDQPAELEQLVLIYGLAVLCLPFTLQWVFQGHHRMRDVAAMLVLRQVVFAAVILVFLREPGRLWLVAVAEVAAAASVAVASLWLCERRFQLRVRLARALSSSLLREGSTIGLGQILWSLRLYGATLVVGLVASREDVGYFGASMRIAIGLNAFVLLYFFNLFPSLSSSWLERTGSFQRLMGRSLRAAAWFAVGGGALWVLAAPLMTELAYGAHFASAAPALAWLSGVCVLGALHGHFRYGLIAAGLQRYATLATGIGTVVALALIPAGYDRYGVAGAAIAVLLGEAAVLWIAYRLAVLRLGLKGALGELLRPGLCGVPLAIAVVWILPRAMPPPATLAITAGTLALAALVTEPELRAAVQRLGRRWRARR